MNELMLDAKNKFLYYRKAIFLCVMFSFLTVFVLPQIVTFAKQCTWQEIQAGTGQAASHNHSFVQNLLLWCEDIFSGGNVSDIVDVVYVEFGGDSAKLGAVKNPLNIGVTKQVFDIFKGLGLMMCFMFFATSLIADFKIDAGYTENVVRKFVYLVIAIAVIVNANTIVYGIANIGSLVVMKIKGVMSSAPPINQDTIKAFIAKSTTTSDLIDSNKHPIKWMGQNVNDFVSSLVLMISMLIPWAFSKYCKLMVLMTCWSRFFEILIAAMVSPLAFADLSKGNFEQSGALRAVKNVIGLSITGAMILIVFSLTNMVRGQLISSASDWAAFSAGMWQSVLISLVQVGLIQRATDITKQAMGMG